MPPVAAPAKTLSRPADSGNRPARDSDSPSPACGKRVRVMDAARLRAVSNGAAWGDDAQEQCVRLRAVEEAAIRSRRCVIALLPPCRQRKNSSHTPDPLAFDRLRAGSALQRAEVRPRFCRAPPRCLSPPVRFPEGFCSECFPRAFKNEPLPCARMYAALSRHTSIAGRNLCVPRVQRCPPSPGSERSGMMRTSTDSFRGQGRARSQTG